MKVGNDGKGDFALIKRLGESGPTLAGNLRAVGGIGVGVEHADIGNAFRIAEVLLLAMEEAD